MPICRGWLRALGLVAVVLLHLNRRSQQEEEDEMPPAAPPIELHWLHWEDEPEDEQQDSSSSSGQSSDKSGVGTNKSGNGTSKSSGETSGTISGSSSVSALTETSSNDELAQKIEYERLKFENLKIQQELASGKSGAKGAEDSKPGALEKTKTALNDIDLTNPEVQKLMNAKMAEIQELTRAKNLAGQRASLAGGAN